MEFRRQTVVHRNYIGSTVRTLDSLRTGRREHLFQGRRNNRPSCIPHYKGIQTGSPATSFWIGRRNHLGRPPRQSCRTDTAARPGNSSDCPDVLIVDAAYEKWGTRCFAKLIGDWALSVWNPHQQSLIFAKDPIGGRHLYYSLNHAHVTWSSLLEPLLLNADQSFTLNEEYIAGWLSFFPSPHLTPYVGISAVPPSSFVSVARREQKVTKYWDFSPYKKIRYQTDHEYEEHFRSVFCRSCSAPASLRLAGTG